MISELREREQMLKMKPQHQKQGTGNMYSVYSVQYVQYVQCTVHVNETEEYVQ